jgi:hypothetical protein
MNDWRRTNDWQGLTTDKDERLTRTNDWQGLTTDKDERLTRTNDWQGRTTDKDERLTRTNDWQGRTTDKDERLTRTNNWQGRTTDKDERLKTTNNRQRRPTILVRFLCERRGKLRRRASASYIICLLRVDEVVPKHKLRKRGDGTCRVSPVFYSEAGVYRNWA